MSSAYGSLYIKNNYDSINIKSQNTFYPIQTNWIAGDSNISTLNAKLGTITVNNSGEYNLSCNLSVRDPITPGAEILFQIFQNGSAVSSLISTYSSASSLVTTPVIITGIVSALSGDVFDVRVSCISDSKAEWRTVPAQTITVYRANLSVVSSNITLVGDVIGNADNNTVIALQNNPVMTGILGPSEDGFVLTWVDRDGLWEPSAPEGGGVSSVGGTPPIVSSGGSTPVISITAATDSNAGSMSAADKTKLDGIVGSSYTSRTILDVDLRNASTQTFSSDGPYTISTGPGDIPASSSITLQKQNSAHEDVAMVLTNGVGITMSPSNPAIYGGGTRTSPILWILLTTLFPTLDITMGLRIWAQWADDPTPNNTYQICGIDTSGAGLDPSTADPTTGGGFAAFAVRGTDASNGGGGQLYTIFDVGGVQTLGHSNLVVKGGLGSSNRVLQALSPAGLSNFEQTLVGPTGSGWPTLSQLSYGVGAVQSGAAPFNITDAAKFGAFWGSQRNIGSAFTTVLQRIRVDAFGFGV